MSQAEGDLARALDAFPGLSKQAVAPLGGGLIHQSFRVPQGDIEYVLQRVNPIFSPRIHMNIAAVTEHLHAKGLSTFRLLPTRAGELYADLGPAGLWRLLTRVPGVAFETCSGVAQARSAGGLVARFHSALVDLDHIFAPLGIPYHDTPAHLAELRQAVAGERGHRHHGVVAKIADEIFAAVDAWESLDGLPLRVIHGDLKFDNILFAGETGSGKDQARSLIDLDTLSRMPLWIDLGDAWRSWCNEAGEDVAEARLRLDLFEASVEGYLAELTFELELRERASLVHALERISLELSARFAADALRECYFGWDRERFASLGDHNLVRARGQLSLYRQARETRGRRAAALGLD